jgi:glycine betaine/proline transport system permease protein
VTTLPVAGRSRPLSALPRWVPDAAVLVAAVALYAAFHGTATEPSNGSGVFHGLNRLRDWVDANRNSSPVFLYLVNYIRLGISGLFDTAQWLLQAMGWAGVTATAGAVGWIVAGWRTGLLAVAGFLGFGVLGLWDESMDTLALTLSAVLLSLLVGIPLGVLAGRSRRAERTLSPVLDVMQIMPSFAYLAPLTLFFLIGAPAAVVTTMIYAIPPAIRITALAIRQVPSETVEASESLGATRWQTLRKVQLPVASPTILLGINQTVMAALSMVAFTALIDAPGVGVNIMQGVQQVKVGMALDAGLVIVLMAIVLDRITSGAGRAAKSSARDEKAGGGRRLVPYLVTAAAAVGIAVAQVLPAAFPESLNFRFAPYVDDAVGWVETNLYTATDWLKNTATDGLLNPLQTLLTDSPWWLLLAVAALMAWRIGGPRPAVITAACLGLLAALGLWQHSMTTLAAVLVATVLTVFIGVLLGIRAATSRTYAAVQRPFLDAAQTLPNFVYLLPAVALFGASRFTAIVAAVIYAVPPVIRLVEDGIRQVPATVMEAATAAGSTRGQLLRKVQLPMARHALLLAANQGIVMVLAMVVIGGLVGAGALGYDVVAGFSQSEDFGQGLAAGAAIVLLGVMLDRITQGAGAAGAGPRRTTKEARNA